MKVDFPSLAKKNNFKGKKESKSKNSYIAWEETKVSSSSDSENEECANFAFMASHHSDDEHEVNDFEINDKRSYNKL